MSRVPHADDHDLFVGLETGRAVPRVAYAIAKQTFRIGDAGLELIDVRPLRHDLATMRSEQKLPRGSDFWWQKQRTDVVVEGAAGFSSRTAPPDVPTPRRPSL